MDKKMMLHFCAGKVFFKKYFNFVAIVGFKPLSTRVIEHIKIYLFSILCLSRNGKM